VKAKLNENHPIHFNNDDRRGCKIFNVHVMQIKNITLNLTLQ
jgi:ribosome-associated protein YbcJ (S4-like RNA binding protein)